MVIVCEKCETRFHIADGRIPDSGARVRCSRCHHRFQVVPPNGDAPPPPDLPAEDSAPPAAGADPDLDNPEFLFDDDDSSDSEEAETPSDPGAAVELESAPPEPEPGSDRTPEADEDSVFGQPDPGAAGASVDAPLGFETTAISPKPESQSQGDAQPGEEPVFGSQGGPPSPALSIGEPSSDLPPDGAGASADVNDLLGSPEALAPGETLTGGPEDSMPPDLAASEPLLADDLDAGSDDALGWDSLEPAEDDAADEIVPAEQSAASTAEPGRKPSGARPVPSASADLGSRGRASAGFALRALAVAVGLALAAGGVRVVSVRGLVDAPGPEVVQAAGWQAADLQSFRVRDAAGRPVLVVRGSLQRDGGQIAPRVQAVLLDVGGNAVGSPALGLLVRLDDAELAPEPLAARLRGDAMSARTDGRVSGFTVLIPDPPLEARRFRLELLPGGRAT